MLFRLFLLFTIKPIDKRKKLCRLTKSGQWVTGLAKKKKLGVEKLIFFFVVVVALCGHNKPGDHEKCHQNICITVPTHHLFKASFRRPVLSAHQRHLNMSAEWPPGYFSMEKVTAFNTARI